jgi:hypothetical protein
MLLEEFPNLQLAYLIAESVNDVSWAGALLVTDEHGLPIDFRYVEPIKPTRLQKLIYGDALKRCILLDAIAGTLLKAANPRADWLFTGDPLLLELENRFNGGLAAIGDGEREPLNEVGEWRYDRPGEIALQVAQSGPPIRLTFRAEDKAETEKIASDLALLTTRLDFAEPLKRVEAALKEICNGGAE